MLQKINLKKHFFLLVLVLVLLFCFGMYFFFINPEDEVLKKRCKSGYKENTFQLFSSEQYEIEIPDSSCFIGECCQYSASFRSKKSMDDLKNDLKKVDEDLKTKYPDIDYEIVGVKDNIFFREYSIRYNKK